MSRVVKLNVGGVRYETTRETLVNADPDSFFAKMFQGDMLPSSASADGSVFIDRDGARFALLLAFLRDGALPPFMTPRERAGLHAEAHFFQLRPLLQAFEDPLPSWFHSKNVVRHLELDVSLRQAKILPWSSAWPYLVVRPVCVNDTLHQDQELDEIYRRKAQRQQFAEAVAFMQAFRLDFDIAHSVLGSDRPFAPLLFSPVSEVDLSTINPKTTWIRICPGTSHTHDLAMLKITNQWLLECGEKGIVYAMHDTGKRISLFGTVGLL